MSNNITPTKTTTSIHTDISNHATHTPRAEAVSLTTPDRDPRLSNTQAPTSYTNSPIVSPLPLSRQITQIARVVRIPPFINPELTSPPSEPSQRTLEDGTSIRGYFTNGGLDGVGTATYPDNSSYQGIWRNGQRHGQGQFISPTGETVFTGIYENDRPVSGCMHIPGTQCTYVGNVRLLSSGIGYTPHGTGEMILTDGTRIQGTFQNHAIDGPVTIILPSQMVLQATLNQDGNLHGPGTRTHPDGTIETGHFDNDVWSTEPS